VSPADAVPDARIAAAIVAFRIVFMALLLVGLVCAPPGAHPDGLQ
jgi:hypothetical protein